MAKYNLWPIRQLAPVNAMLATEVEIAASVTSYEALAANPERLYAMFINDSDTPMYLRLGEDAVVSEGIRLNVAGSAESSYEINQTKLYRGVVNVAASAASKTILVTEGT